MKQDPPTQASIVIIGGGCIGCSAAYHLSQLGICDVVGLEREEAIAFVTTGQAAGNIGQVRSSIERIRFEMECVATYRKLQNEQLRRRRGVKQAASGLQRIAGAGTETFINRHSDAANSRVAAEIGVSTNVLFVDEDSGVMLREFVDGSAPENEDFLDFRKIQRAAKAIKKVHECGRPFETRFDIL